MSSILSNTRSSGSNLFDSLHGVSASQSVCSVMKLQDLRLTRNNLLSFDLTSRKAAGNAPVVSSSGSCLIGPILILEPYLIVVFFIVHIVVFFVL